MKNKTKPTIAELEKLLNAGGTVRMLPNGEITVFDDTYEDLQSKLASAEKQLAECRELSEMRLKSEQKYAWENLDLKHRLGTQGIGNGPTTLELVLKERNELETRLAKAKELLTEVFESIGHDSHYIPTLEWLKATKEALANLGEEKCECDARQPQSNGHQSHCPKYKPSDGEGRISK